MRRIFVSRSSFEKPRPLERFSRTTSPSRISRRRWLVASRSVARQRLLRTSGLPGVPPSPGGAARANDWGAAVVAADARVQDRLARAVVLHLRGLAAEHPPFQPEDRTSNPHSLC